ncbi:MAG: hypothetical protein ACM3ML_23325 [Micromonosporaceae bacterium]
MPSSSGGARAGACAAALLIAGTPQAPAAGEVPEIWELLPIR